VSASLPESLYSAAIVFPLVAGASGTVPQSKQNTSDKTLPLHDTRRAESLRSCYCRNADGCSFTAFFKTWLASTGSWIFSLTISSAVQAILVFYLWLAGEEAADTVLNTCNPDLINNQERQAFLFGTGGRDSANAGESTTANPYTNCTYYITACDMNEWPIRLFGSLVINMYCLRELFETLQMIIWVERQKWTSRTEYLQVLRADPEYSDPEKDTYASGMGFCYKFYCYLLCLIKLGIGGTLWWFGSRFVFYSASNKDVVLNCVAILFVLDIDDALFKIAVPGHYQDLLKNLPTIALQDDAKVETKEDETCCERSADFCKALFAQILFYGGLWLVFGTIFGLTIFQGWANCEGRIFHPEGNPFEYFSQYT
jgi:hypothetical protein